MTPLLCSGLKYLIPQWWEFASYTDAKNKEMNLLNTQSPADVRGSRYCKPPGLQPHAPGRPSDPVETPQSHFCPDRQNPCWCWDGGLQNQCPPAPLHHFPSLCSPAHSLRMQSLCQNSRRGNPTPSRACGCSGSGMLATRGWPKPWSQGTACSWWLSHPQLHEAFIWQYVGGYAIQALWSESLSIFAVKAVPQHKILSRVWTGTRETRDCAALFEISLHGQWSEERDSPHT